MWVQPKPKPRPIKNHITTIIYHPYHNPLPTKPYLTNNHTTDHANTIQPNPPKNHVTNKNNH